MINMEIIIKEVLKTSTKLMAVLTRKVIRRGKFSRNVTL